MAPIGRLAPSPTGHLHLGHALSFLTAYWSMRHQGGSIVLRLEDVDVERASLEHVDSARRDLEWLGISWEHERLQSIRLAELVDAAVSLEHLGVAYRCVCTRGDLKALGAPQAGQVEVRYPGTCRQRFQSAADAGPGAALRFFVAAGTTEISDLVYGRQEFNVAEEVGDFVILRKNGLPSYQLAVVVDDAFDGVTEVTRGADLLPSAARQKLLAGALGLSSPRYLHVPLVTDEAGVRLAKRNDALSLGALRAQGVRPEALINWAAQVTGQLTPGERAASADEISPHFARDRIPRENIPVSAELIQSFLRR